MRGFFSIGVYGPKTEMNIGTLWRTANIFGASFIYTVGRRYKKQATDTLHTPKHIPLFHFASVEDLYEHLPHGCRLVGVELTPEAQASHRYAHPQQCCYLLGAEDNGLPQRVVDKCHDLIRLPGERSLNVAVAGSMVVYDRWQQLSKEVRHQPLERALEMT